ncbi:hypothetical protein [Acinetobacter sp. SWAC5]|nr:hypothetical protein [Acinetobacter sp. SWAC5]
MAIRPNLSCSGSSSCWQSSVPVRMAILGWSGMLGTPYQFAISL